LAAATRRRAELSVTPDRRYSFADAVADSLSPDASAGFAPNRMHHRSFGPRLAKGALALGGALVLGGVALFAATHMSGRLAAPPLSDGDRLNSVATVAAAPRAQDEAPAGPARNPASLPELPRAKAGSPEGRLIAVYRAIAETRIGEAMDLATALAQDLPNFRLAQLVYADLLLMRRGQLDNFGGELQRGDPAAAAELEQMRDEALRRIAALRERPPTDKLPAQFVVLPERIHHAIAVDVSRSRLYLFENTPQGVRLVADYYASIGKQGADKLVEGDQRTPLGVYFISDVANPKTLEDRFGSGALALNYPNANDRAAGRTGSGILLHGVPSSTYARAPRATDGCVALANDDLTKLAQTIAPRDTPVVIAQQIDWVEPERTRDGHARFLEVLHDWQQARVKADEAALATYYAPGVVEEAAASAPPPTRAGRRARPAVPAVPKGFDDVAVLSWNDKRPLMVVSYRERGADGKLTRRAIRQYWTRESGQWKIFSQGANA
jgi:hypothetical protein